MRFLRCKEIHLSDLKLYNTAAWITAFLDSEYIWVRLSDVPADYPEVLDKRLYPDAVVSENYYPNWSRAAFMDLRNVKNLSLESIHLKALQKDERLSVIIENCESLNKSEIEIL